MLLGIQTDNPKQIDITDPASDDFYHFFRDVAKKNTLIYEDVFATLPTDRVRHFNQVSDYTEAPKLRDTDPLKVNRDRRTIRRLSFPGLGSRIVERSTRTGGGISPVLSR